MPEFEPRGRTAVITGASRGIGAGLAQAFERQGLRLGLCSRGQPILPDGPDVVSRRLDIRDEKAVDEFALRVEERFGAVDLWVNNAGVLEPIAKVRDTETSDFREHVEINLVGVFLGSRAYVRHLERVGTGGVLINISSGAARKPYEGWAAYCAAKAGVDRFTECLQLEEGSRGLRAYSVAPGVVDTQMQELIRGCTPDRFPDVERFHEMKRDGVFNTTDFIADRLLELAFDPSARDGEVCLYLPDEKP